MSWAGMRFGRGTRLIKDGETAEIVELAAARSGNEVTLKDSPRPDPPHVTARTASLDRVRVIPDADGPAADDSYEIAGTVLGRLTPAQRARVAERASHIEEVLTGYRSGSPELAGPGEPRPEHDPTMIMGSRRCLARAFRRAGSLSRRSGRG